MFARNPDSRTYRVYRVPKVFEKYHYLPNRATIAFERIGIQFDQDDRLKTLEAPNAAAQCAKLGALDVHLDQVQASDLVLFAEKIQRGETNARWNPRGGIYGMGEVSRTGVGGPLHYKTGAGVSERPSSRGYTPRVKLSSRFLRKRRMVGGFGSNA